MNTLSDNNADDQAGSAPAHAYQEQEVSLIPSKNAVKE